jgi:hypothetical protein
LPASVRAVGIVLYLLMALMGIGWAAIVSLPFSIMSQRVDQSRIGLYMGVFNLSRAAATSSASESARS